ncbi:hypothetical protein J5N97_003413 [Dioscorea zingiberensis]|uniref:Uncharacterized protein n=1 Tax=Dioscorea zingiberensis TaxID=325984 RepID=A0A9D5D5X5_9LILI|nr:hypothetical protein J5N97_003413 [Dioscorea zingiberensis]
MRDITNDGKGAQLDPSESTFLGLDDNRLCRWDMRDRGGIVQNLANSMESPVLQWTQGHPVLTGTNFQCFASTGDGSIVVTENGKQERHLVATVGKFSIIWNFQQVKNSRHECYLNQEGLKSCYCYKMRPQRRIHRGQSLHAREVCCYIRFPRGPISSGNPNESKLLQLIKSAVASCAT